MKTTTMPRLLFLGAFGVLISFPLLLIGQHARPPKIEWIREYEGLGQARAAKVIRVTDGGFVVTGSTSPPQHGFSSLDQLYLLKTDLKGIKQWEGAFGQSETGCHNGYSVMEASDRGILAVGDEDYCSLVGVEFTSIMKADAAGDLTWFKVHGGMAGRSACMTANGGVIAIGSSFDSDEKKINLSLINMDASGGKVWAKELDGNGSVLGYEISRTRDGNFIIASTVSGGASNMAQLIEIDDSGEVLWEMLSSPSPPGDEFKTRPHAFLLKLEPENPVAAGPFLRGDANGDHEVDLPDVSFILGSLFFGEAELPCLDAADANDDGAVDLTDPIRILDALFISRSPLPKPSGAPGLDPTPDDLGCLR